MNSPAGTTTIRFAWEGRALQVRSSDSETLSRIRSLAGYIIVTRESEFSAATGIKQKGRDGQNDGVNLNLLVYASRGIGSTEDLADIIAPQSR